MNVVDLILVAILACVTLHFYFRKRRKPFLPERRKRSR